MAIYKGDKKAALYKGDKHPAELYCGEQKAAGYRVEEQRGSDMIFENTYNAQFDQLSVYGKSTQVSSMGRKESAKSVTSFEYDTVQDESGVTRCVIDELTIKGRTEQNSSSQSVEKAEGVSSYTYRPVLDETGKARCVVEGMTLTGKTSQKAHPESVQSAERVKAFSYAPYRDEEGVHCVIDRLAVSGSMQQKTYQGYQLLDRSAIREVAKHESYQSHVSYDGKDVVVSHWAADLIPYEWIKDHLKPNTEYTISADITRLENHSDRFPNLYSTSVRMILYSYGTKEVLGSYLDVTKYVEEIGVTVHTSSTFVTPSTINDEAMKWSFLVYTNRYTNDAGQAAFDTFRFANLMLTEGSEEHVYEPYVGKRVAPNFDFPQEIVGVNSPEVVVHGKNLFSGWDEYIPVQAGSYYVTSFDSPDSSRADIEFFDKDQVNISGDADVEIKNFYRTANYWRLSSNSTRLNTNILIRDNRVAYLRFRAHSALSTYVDYEGAQLEKGQQATEYEEYTLPQCRTFDGVLYGNGTVNDTYEPDVIINGEHKARLTRWWQKIVFDGTKQNDAWSQDGKSPWWFAHNRGRLFEGRNNQLENICFCSHGKIEQVKSFNGPGLLTASGVGFAEINVERMGLDMNTDPSEKLAELYAAGTPFYIVYQLAEPIIEIYDAEPFAVPHPTMVIESTDTMDVTVRTPQCPSVDWPAKLQCAENPSIMVHGKNLLNVNGFVQETTSYYVSYTKTSSIYPEIMRVLTENVGKTLTYSCKVEGETTGVRIGQMRLYSAQGEALKIITPGVAFSVLEKDLNASQVLIYGASSGNRSVVRELQIEVGDTATEYEQFAEPQQMTFPFVLYGDGTINDTIEPDVIVNGEHHCRVTRRWGKSVIDGTESITDDYKPFLVFFRTAKLKSQIGDSFPNTHGLKVRTSNSTGYDIAVDDWYKKTGMGDATLEELVAWLADQHDKGTPFAFLYPLDTPIVELYDPQPVDAFFPTTIFECKSEAVQPTMDLLLQTPASPSPWWPKEIVGVKEACAFSKGRNMFHEQGAANSVGVSVVWDEQEQTFTLNGQTNHPGNVVLSSGLQGLFLSTQTKYTFTVDYVSGQMEVAEGTGITFAYSLFDRGNTKFLRGSTQPVSPYERNVVTGLGFGEVCYLYLQCWRVGTKFTDFKIRVMVEEGTTAHDWEPYVYAHTQPADIVLYGNSEIADTIEPDVIVNGEHKRRVTRYWGKITLTGNEMWIKSMDSYDKKDASDRWFQLPTSNRAYGTYLECQAWCTHFQLSHIGIWATTGWADSFTINSHNQLHLNIGNQALGVDYGFDDADTVTRKFKEYLQQQYKAGTPVTVVYRLETPIIELGEPQPLVLAYPVTILGCGGEGIQPAMDVAMRTPSSPSPEYPQPVVTMEAPAITVRRINLSERQVFSFGRGYSICIYGSKENEAFLKSLVGKTVTVSFDFKTDYTPTGSMLVYQYQGDGYGLLQTSVEIPVGAVKANQVSHYSTTGVWTKLQDPTVHGNYGSWIIYPLAVEDRIDEHHMEITNFMIEFGEVEHPYIPYQEPQKYVAPNGLPGIPVSSGGNYTDETGQQWICDEIDLAHGMYIQRTYPVVFDGTQTIAAWQDADKQNETVGFYSYVVLNGWLGLPAPNGMSNAVICDCLPSSSYGVYGQKTSMISMSGGTSNAAYVGLRYPKKLLGITDDESYTEYLSKIKKYLSAHPTVFIYALNEPIVTPLPVQMKTHWPTTSIESNTDRVIAKVKVVDN